PCSLTSSRSMRRGSGIRRTSWPCDGPVYGQRKRPLQSQAVRVAAEPLGPVPEVAAASRSPAPTAWSPPSSPTQLRLRSSRRVKAGKLSSAQPPGGLGLDVADRAQDTRKARKGSLSDLLR